MLYSTVVMGCVCVCRCVYRQREGGCLGDQKPGAWRSCVRGEEDQCGGGCVSGMDFLPYA